MGTLNLCLKGPDNMQLENSIFFLWAKFLSPGRRVDIDPGGLVFIFFHCTMAQNTHGMGSCLSGATLEILGHPNATGRVKKSRNYSRHVINCLNFAF